VFAPTEFHHKSSWPHRPLQWNQIVCYKRDPLHAGNLPSTLLMIQLFALSSECNLPLVITIWPHPF